MAPVSVQLGLLAIAKDWAHADLKDVETATARTTAAGHRVVVQQVVGDTEGAIRDTLRRWIDDTSIDAIIVLGGAESEAVSSALKPLITAPLQGFSDLFRWLMFQEQGASAMLSSAEAARCSDTFVFVLPGAIGAAMDKLILPQFDSTTTPKNLVEQMPRLRGDNGGVPQVIAPEKTQGGSGMPARIPAASTATRAKTQSTGAHVIHRGKVPVDPETAPIDLERLEREIAATRGEDSTRKTDLARFLPKRPPGAEDETRTDALAAPPAPMAAVTINPRKRVEGSKDAPTKPANGPNGSGPTEATAIASTPTGPVASRTSTGSKKSSPTIQAPVVPQPAKVTIPPMLAAKTIVSGPPTSMPDARARRASASLPPQVPSTRHKPSKPPPAPSAVVPATSSDDADTGVSHKAAAPRKAPRILTDVTVSATLESVQGKGNSGAAMPLDVEDLETIDADALDATPADDDSPVEPPVAVKAEAKPAPKIESTPAPKIEAKPAPKIEAKPAPKIEAKPAPKASVDPTAATDVAISARADTGPTRRESGGLPRGTFNYPPPKRGMHPALKFAGFAAIAAAGFAAFVVIAGRDTRPSKAPKPETSNPVVTNGSATTATPIEPTVGSAAAGSADAIAAGSAAPPAPVEPTTAPTTTAPPTTRPPTTRPPTTRPPTTTTVATTTPSQVETTTTEPVKAETPPVADDCDEQSCVMNNYDKPCCARFKPANDKPLVVATPVATSSNEPPEEVTRPMVLSAMNAVKARVTTCGEKNPAKGTVKIKVNVTPEGAVKETSVAESPDDALGACVAQAIKAAKFGVTQKGGSFTYPFVF